MQLFIRQLFDPGTRFFYLAWVLVVTVSIVLHELGHGFAAIRYGDRTPEREGRLTGNPLVHMGAVSIAVLLILGMAWGQMPIDPTRLKGKYAEAKVSFAGPLVNLALALSSLIGLGLVSRFTPSAEPNTAMGNLQQLLGIAGSANLLLMIFNLMPVPPLDGSHMLANFHRGYARFTDDPSKQGVFLLMFAGVFALTGVLWGPVFDISDAIVRFVETVGG